MTAFRRRPGFPGTRIPHLRREVFGMVILPLVGILSGTGLIGLRQRAFNPAWSIQYPKRCRSDVARGSIANFVLAILAGIIMRIGLTTGIFLPGSISSERHC